MLEESVSVLSRSDIETIISKLARRISSDYKGRELVLIGVLKGAFIFLADLVRELTIPVEIDFVGAASYGSQSVSSGKIRLTKSIELDIKDKDLLIIEDIIDTGLTLQYLIDYTWSMGPRSVKVCTLISKSERRATSIVADYIGHSVDSGFLVGYGLDYAEKYRNLPGISHIQIQEPA